MTIGERIKQLRSEKGFSQEKLAEKLNVSRSAVAKWEADGGVPEIDNLRQLSSVFDISIDELVGNADRPQNRKKAETADNERHDFGDQRYDIELAGWNDGVYGVYIIEEDHDFLYYYQYADKASVYGMIGRKHITSVLPTDGKGTEKPPVNEMSREYFCGKPVKIELAKRDGLIRGLLDFRDDAYRHVVICSFEEDALHLQFGGTLALTDITRIEALHD